MNPLVTVVVPTYNRDGWIMDAVDSVLAQTHAELELVVVDDGSTDNTSLVLSGVDDPRMRLVRQENRGVSAARNLGIREGRGDLIALLDSDDYWLERKLEIQVAHLMERGLDICQTEEVWIRNGVRVNPMKKHAKPSGRFFDEALRLCLVSPSCVLFTRKYFLEFGPFDESLPACEDYDLWLKTLARIPIGLCPEVLTVKRGGHSDQLSRSVKNLDYYRILAIINLLNTPDLADRERGAAERELERKAAIYIGGCRKRGRLDEASRLEGTVCGALTGK